MAQCTFIKPDTTRCRGLATRASGFSQLCAAHDPATQERRKAGASKGGQGGSASTREIQALRVDVKSLITKVLDGEVATGRAAVALQGYNVLLRAAEQERRILDTEELADRIAALEAAKAKGLWAA